MKVDRRFLSLLSLFTGALVIVSGACWSANLLANPGFEDGVAFVNQAAGYEMDVAGWHYTCAANYSGFANSAELAWGGGTRVRSGSASVRLFHYGGWSEAPYALPGWRSSTVSQVVDVEPGQDYIASAWVYTYLAEGIAIGDQFRVGINAEELDAAGNVVASHQNALTSDSDANQWKQVWLLFHTSDQAHGVRFALINNWYARMDENHITWDDCSLEGLPSTSKYIQGTVTGPAGPLAGATVTVGSLSATTDAGGAYSIRCSSDSTHATVRVARSSYFAQRKHRALSERVTVVDFELVAKGDNLIPNAGFDDDAYAGGWVENDLGSGYRRSEWGFIRDSTGLTPYYTSGENAICLFTRTPPGGFWYYQDISVVAGQQYTAAARTKVSMASGASTAWGNLTDAQVAGLLIKEYDAAGAVIRAHPLVSSRELTSWEQLSYAFTTRPDAATVRVGPYVWSLESAATNWWWRRVTFDDVELRGPAGAFGLSGIVRSGSMPIAGAVVVVAERDGEQHTCTTGADGRYAAAVTFGSHYSLSVYKADYCTQTAEVTVTRPVQADFDLTAIDGNLLFNPCFDDPAGWLSGGWKTSGPAIVGHETSVAQFGPVFLDTPAQATYIRGPNASGRIYQDVPAMPNAQYTASCRFLAATDSRYGSAWGTDPWQVAALYLQELDAAGQPIGGEQRAFAQVTTANRGEWKTLTTSLTTTSSTAYVRVGGYAFLADNFDTNLARAIFDTFSLKGPAVPGIGLAQARSLSDGAAARLTGKVVSAAFDSFFYMQEPDRSCGVRVSGRAAPGDVVDVVGAVTTIGGERAITAAGIIRRSAVQVPRPLGMPVRAVRSGLSPMGLYVTLWGRVVDRRASHFLIDDGSGSALKVYGNAMLGDVVRVTGALGAETSGGGVAPVLRAVQTTFIEQDQSGTVFSLEAGLLFDEECRTAANQAERNYWWVYMHETLDRLGLSASVVSTDQLAAKLPGLSVLFIGPDEADRLTGAHVQVLSSWVRGGGVLIASATEGLDGILGNELVTITPSAGEFAVSGSFMLRDTAFSQGIQTPLHPNSPMLAVGPVRWVRPVTSMAIGDDGDLAVITARRYGQGWAFYFGLNLGQTFWVIQQGRPVDRDYDGDGWYRSGDAMVIGYHQPEVPYTDQLLFLLRNMTAVKPHPLVHQLPAMGSIVPDMLFFYGGDDECGSGIQVPAAQFMHSRGLPYHINAMPYNGVFGLTPAEMAQCEALGTELSIHYNFVDGFNPIGLFTKWDVDYQTGLFIDYFGKTPVSSVNHWVTWTGWHEPAQWMMEAGLKGDHGRFCVPLTTGNPTNRIGYAFGTAFPYHFWTDYTTGNHRLDFVEMPISGYELGYQGSVGDPAQVYRAIFQAQYYGYTFSFFYHPVYLAYYQACRDAVDTMLNIVDYYGTQVLHTTPDNLTLWWMDRSRISISNVQYSSNRLTFDATKPSAGNYIVAVPLGGYEAVSVPYPHAVREQFGVRWLMLVLEGGSTHVTLDLRRAE